MFAPIPKIAQYRVIPHEWGKYQNCINAINGIIHKQTNRFILYCALKQLCVELQNHFFEVLDFRIKSKIGGGLPIDSPLHTEEVYVCVDNCELGVDFWAFCF